MKLVKEAPKPDPWSLEVCCRKCKAVFLVEEGDVWHKGTGNSGRFYWHCQVCRKENNIAARSIPRRVRIKTLENVRARKEEDDRYLEEMLPRMKAYFASDDHY